MSGEGSRFARPLCPDCGPGYRIGDEGCRHAPTASDSGRGLGAGEREALAEVIAAHLPCYRRACECGWGALDHEDFDAVFAAHLAEQVAVWLAGQRETVAEAIDDVLERADRDITSVTYLDLADAVLAALGVRS